MSEQKFVRYGDREMEMSPGMTLEQAKAIMARHFPELAEPEIKTEKKGERTVYVFSKKAGRKGAAVTARDLAERLGTVPAVEFLSAEAYVHIEMYDAEGLVELVGAGNVTALAARLEDEASAARAARLALSALPSLASESAVIL